MTVLTLQPATQVQVQPTALTETIRISGELATLLCTPSKGLLGAIKTNFRLLADLIEALPPTLVSLGTMGYLRIRVESSSRLHDTQEFNASRYQLLEMSRKLSRIAELADMSSMKFSRM